jgi:hypothetical protein
LTIKLTLDTNLLIALTYIFTSAPRRILAARRDCNLCCPSIFNCQRPADFSSEAKTQHPFRILTPEF